MTSLLDLQQLHIKDEGAVRRDAVQLLRAVGQRGRDGQATLAANGHAGNANVPAGDDLALADAEGERGALLVGVEDLAALELANVAHADAVAVLDNTAGADLAVVNGDAPDNLDTGLALAAVLGLLLRGGLLDGRASGALLEGLGELDALLVLLLLSSDGVALVVLELLGLLLAQLGLVGTGLGNQVLEARLGVLSGALLALALLGVGQLGDLLVRVNLLDAADKLVELVELVNLVAVELLQVDVRGQVVVVVVRVLLVAVVLIVLDEVVTRQVDGVATGNGEEDGLAGVNGQLKRLLVGLYGGDGVLAWDHSPVLLSSVVAVTW